jgi:hypothetical protein
MPQLRIFQKEIKSTLNQDVMDIIGERGLLVRVIIIFKVWMHLKVFLKLKNPKNSLFWVKKTPTNPKNPKKPQKNPKKRVFSNPGQVDPLLIARGLSPVHHFLPDLRGVKDAADDHGGGGGGDDDKCRKNGGDLNDEEDTADGERTVGVRVRRNYIRYRTYIFACCFFRGRGFDPHPSIRSFLGNILLFLSRRVLTLP